MNYYAILGLSSKASVADLKRAYRRLSRRYHPGINPGDRTAAAAFQRITEAYETLIDAERRRRYDEAGGHNGDRAEQTFEFTGFDFSVAAQGPQAATFSELFAEALHPVGAADRGKPQTGSDLYVTVSISFDEAMQGADRQVTLTRYVGCDGCQGAGQMQTAEHRCSSCQGSGHLRWARGHMVFTKSCASCGGTGRERFRPCVACAGQGRRLKPEVVAVRIPAGIVDGARLRVADRGHAGTIGAKSGDLYIDVQVRPHPVLRREGDDLHLVVPVAVHEAVLGTRIEIPSFDGPVRLRVPPGTQAGQRFRFRERGAATVSGRRGDLLVEVRLTLPAVVDERSKELMREFARLNSEDVRRSVFEQLTGTR